MFMQFLAQIASFVSGYGEIIFFAPAPRHRGHLMTSSAEIYKASNTSGQSLPKHDTALSLLGMNVAISIGHYFTSPSCLPEAEHPKSRTNGRGRFLCAYCRSLSQPWNPDGNTIISRYFICFQSSLFTHFQIIGLHATVAINP